jgi:mannose-6-phosphate isomerase-like protein (cupin superfamily)
MHASMTKVVRIADVAAMSQPDNELLLRALVSAADTEGGISVTWVQLSGRHRRLRTARSTRVYLVLAGAVTMRIGLDEPQLLEAGQLLVVAAGTPYELSGIGTYLVINAPAFHPGDDEYLDDGHLSEPEDSE